MITTETNHPARSPEFLSRRHDGELEAAESRAFEAHRVECPECRQAVEDFEGTLTLYRAAPTPPPPSDLPERILRRVRAQTPSRRPFGVSFGIDFRWAGLLAATMLLLVIGTPLLLRRKAAPQPGPAALPAIRGYVVEGVPPEPAAEKKALAPPAAEDKEDVPKTEAPPRRLRKDSGSEYGDRVASTAPEAAVAKSAEPFAAPAPPTLQGSVTREEDRRQEDELASGERVSANAARAAAAPPAPRLMIQAADGEGPAPAVASPLEPGRLETLRGRQFVLVVDPQGKVLEVEILRPADSRTSPAPPRSKAAQAAADAATPEPLRELRFEAGSRPRRLLVWVE